MIPYNNPGNQSGISAYEVGDTWIRIQFSNGGIYEYDYSRPGIQHVETMKRLAASGDNLNTYINKYVRENYSHRLS